MRLGERESGYLLSSMASGQALTSNSPPRSPSDTETGKNRKINHLKIVVFVLQEGSVEVVVEGRAGKVTGDVVEGSLDSVLRVCTFSHGVLRVE